MSSFFALGLGLATKNSRGEIIEAYFPQPILKPSSDLVNAIKQLGLDNGTLELSATQIESLATQVQDSELKAQMSGLHSEHRTAIAVLLEKDSDPASVAEAYLKLQILSHRLAKPHQVNLNGIFASLPNLAWTNEGPIDMHDINASITAARADGRWLNVKSVDKFPPMTDYVVPDGVRIAHTARVRLGAHIGKGTTIMHEGFVNFNAGTAGASMIEGRISAGVYIGEGSDLGGGSSTMGTLSGGGNVVISVGENCLIGANAGTGIALGDRCIIEAGLYITAGTKVIMLDDKNQNAGEVKARELSGKSDLLFRRNSISGSIECKTNKTVVELNEELHINN